MNRPLQTLLVLATLAAAGCVSQGKYDEAVAKTQLTRAELSQTRTELHDTIMQAERRADQVARLQALLDELAKSSTDEHASNAARIDELRKLLDASKAAHAAAESRAALFRSVALRLKKQVDAGDLTVVLRDGRMVLQLPNDVLFDTGRTELKPGGKAALTAVAGVLTTLSKRHFQVAGHTDTVPIKNDRFASNWELSSARALGVAHFLMDQGVGPETLSAAGYGEFDPVADNGNADGRKRNRRTEIVLQPNIDDLVRVP